jgi:hypothetical protein
MQSCWSSSPTPHGAADGLWTVVRGTWLRALAMCAHERDYVAEIDGVRAHQQSVIPRSRWMSLACVVSTHRSRPSIQYARFPWFPTAFIFLPRVQIFRSISCPKKERSFAVLNRNRQGCVQCASMDISTESPGHCDLGAGALGEIL